VASNGIFQTGKSRHYQTAIAALISKATIAEAAAEAQISERTLQRWLLKPEFKTELAAAKSRILDGAINKLRSAAGGAVGTLIQVSDATGELASSRVAAAKAIIELALRAGTIEDINRRLEELEHGEGEG
jgi:hypothetical protein